MKPSRFSEGLIIGMLEEQQAGVKTAHTRRKYGITSAEVPFDAPSLTSIPTAASSVSAGPCPEALKPVVGKSIEKVSLGTRDPIEARIRHAGRLADLDLRWAALRQGSAKLSHKQTIAIAGEFYVSPFAALTMAHLR